METKRLQAHRNNGVDQLVVSLDVTTTSVGNTTFSATGTFERAFESAPLVIGSNVPVAGQAAAVKVSATAVEVYLRGTSPTPYTDGTVTVSVTLEGKVA